MHLCKLFRILQIGTRGSPMPPTESEQRVTPARFTFARRFPLDLIFCAHFLAVVLGVAARVELRRTLALREKGGRVVAGGC
mmetsp:Transcript_21554/g.68764  ORF Transcript_21554/g.68764 Transcript_21554/m.68764 type:complete len:81 (-) Transcript_21554:33-275(-)